MESITPWQVFGPADTAGTWVGTCEGHPGDSMSSCHPGMPQVGRMSRWKLGSMVRINGV